MSININVGSSGTKETALRRALWNLTNKVVLSQVDSLPLSPGDGDIYILTASAASHPNDIAFYSEGDWIYLDAEEGWVVYVLDDDISLKFSGSIWEQFGTEIDIASASDYRANVADKVLETDIVWSAAATVALTDAATIVVDMSTFINATVTLGGNRTLGQPSNTKVGQSGFIRINQDGTGSRTLAYHADWKFAGGTDPVLTTTASATDVLFYQVIETNFIYASLVKGLS